MSLGKSIRLGLAAKLAISVTASTAAALRLRDHAASNDWVVHKSRTRGGASILGPLPRGSSVADQPPDRDAERHENDRHQWNGEDTEQMRRVDRAANHHDRQHRDGHRRPRRRRRRGGLDDQRRPGLDRGRWHLDDHGHAHEGSEVIRAGLVLAAQVESTQQKTVVRVVRNEGCGGNPVGGWIVTNPPDGVCKVRRKAIAA